jgi:predicted double-glycine peptidase
MLMTLALSLSVLAVLVGGPAVAAEKMFSGTLSGYQETPSTLSTPATGTFKSKLSKDESTLTYELTYSALTGTVLQSHIHFGQRALSGNIVVFLCQTTTNPDPTGLAPTCPQDTSAGPVTGSLTAANMVGNAAGQGIAAGEFAELIQALRAGVTYANVHSSAFPSGEIRAQLK